MKMNFCTPELPVTDVGAAIDALRQLGFRDAWTYEDSFACMFGDGDIEIYLRKDANPQPVTLYFKVDDADAFYARYQASAEVVTPIQDTSWGMREFVGRIVDGHVFRIGHGQAEAEDRRTTSRSSGA